MAWQSASRMLSWRAYFSDMSSVGFRAGVVYGLGTLATAVRFLAHRAGIVTNEKFRR